MKIDTPEDAIEDNEEDWETFQEELVNSVNGRLLVFIFEQTLVIMFTMVTGYQCLPWLPMQWLPQEILRQLLIGLQDRCLLLRLVKLFFEQDRGIPGFKKNTWG